MNHQHQELAAGKWDTLTLPEQMANIGSEVERTIKWRNKGNKEYSQLAFERALELIDLSLTNKKSAACLRELARVREALADYFVFDNSYKSSDKTWQNYFYVFNYAARMKK